MRNLALLIVFTLSSLTFAQTAADLFDENVLHEVRLDLNPGDWQTLKANFLDNTYYPANFRWRDATVQSVGIRSRGTGSRSADKPGLRVDFNRYEDGQQFLGLKSVILDNATQDVSLIKERIAMSIFRRMGVPAPKVTHTRLFVNGEYAGVYAIVEPIDKRFASLNFGDDNGYLFEFRWISPYYFEFPGEDPAFYVPDRFEPKTHESNPQPEELINWIRFVNHASDDDFVSQIGDFIDVRIFAIYLAVENWIGEWDGVSGYAGMNNFYVYRLPGDTHWRFIPWDKDVAFQHVDHSVVFNFQDNVLTRRLWQLVPEFRRIYVESLLQTTELTGGLDGWMEQEVRRISDQIRTAVYSDSFPKCADTQLSCAAPQFEASVSNLHDFALYRGELVDQQLNELDLFTPEGQAVRRASSRDASR